jgi:inorganic pyrophosphatase
MMKSYSPKTVCLGEKYTLGYAIYLTDKTREMDNIKEPLQTRLLSFIHDVPVYPISNPYRNANIVNMIVEIPQFTTEKMEIVTTADNNPIMYDLKDGQIRNVTYHAKSAEKPGYPFHYGAIPQTWENSLEIDHRTGLLGDDDPLDCFDISLIPRSIGSIGYVKVLGAIAMIDDGMTDWKLVGINIDDPMANLYNDIDQVPVTILDQIIDFLKFYKLPNVTQFDKKMIWNAEESMEIVRSLHNEWIRHKKPRSV